MLIPDFRHASSRRVLLITLSGIVVGAALGLLAGVQPLMVGAAIGSVAMLACFFSFFEQSVLGLLILRSSLDIFSAQQIPSAFAIGLDILTLLYVLMQWFTRRPVQTDRFWWCLLGWVFFQGLWVVLLPLGGLGMDGSMLPNATREWIRLFSWAMVYLLVMQLKGRVPPKQVVYALFFALAFPALVALLQSFLPSVLPPMLAASGGDLAGTFQSAGKARIRGTLGVANTFATFIILYIGLTWWRMGQSRHRLPWMALLGLLAFFLIFTKTLFSLMMIAAFIIVMIVPRLSAVSLLGGLVLFALIIGFFGSTDFGQQRLGEIGQTPLMNPDIDISRAILLSQGDGNSFNWRLAYWTQLLTSWELYPVMGYGLGLSIIVGGGIFLPHNDFVRALVDGGIVGFITFLLFLVAQSLRLLYLAQASPEGSARRSLCFILLAISISIPVGMLTENVWSHTTLFMYWWTLMAVAGWDWDEQSATASKPNPVYSQPA